MRENNINFELQGKVRKYLEHLMTKESNSEKEQEIFRKLTHSLKKELMLNSNGKLLSQIPFFTNNFCEETVEDLSFCLQKIRYSPEEYIYKLNETDDGSLFLIENGSLRGFRHRNRLPVRGQRTHTNARTARRVIFGMALRNRTVQKR